MSEQSTPLMSEQQLREQALPRMSTKDILGWLGVIQHGLGVLESGVPLGIRQSDDPYLAYYRRCVLAMEQELLKRLPAQRATGTGDGNATLKQV
ncbi:MAG TPA: hypothetical protein VEL31_24055 [Ktedonobacteraceae bacterium]|nr:hypothetical protein [Ktedonobacteraceae bacterium]